MPIVRVLLLDRETGDEAWHEDLVESQYLESQEFWWTEGNGACDCNRGDFLARALGKPEPNLSCSDTRIAIVRAEIDGVAQDWADDATN
jgi:hypothetical protein